MDDPSERGTGRTTYQITEAPLHAIYIYPDIVNGACPSEHYYRALARDLGRADLDFRPLSWLNTSQGTLRFPVAVDHAAMDQMTPIQKAMFRIIRELETSKNPP